MELRQCSRIAAAERSQHRFFRQSAGLQGVIKIRGYRVTAIECGPGTAAGAFPRLHAQRGLPVFLFHHIFDFHCLPFF
jgi:hypothetical protein